MINASVEGIAPIANIWGDMDAKSSASRPITEKPITMIAIGTPTSRAWRACRGWKLGPPTDGGGSGRCGVP